MAHTQQWWGHFCLQSWHICWEECFFGAPVAPVVWTTHLVFIHCVGGGQTLGSHPIILRSRCSCPCVIPSEYEQNLWLISSHWNMVTGMGCSFTDCVALGRIPPCWPTHCCWIDEVSGPMAGRKLLGAKRGFQPPANKKQGPSVLQLQENSTNSLREHGSGFSSPVQPLMRSQPSLTWL